MVHARPDAVTTPTHSRPKSQSVNNNSANDKSSHTNQDASTPVEEPLKVWWRFVEADQEIDQEFFFQLPNRKAAALVRTQSGGFRLGDVGLVEPEKLLIQGSSVTSIPALAALIANWTKNRRSRVVLKDPSGAELMFAGPQDQDEAAIAELIVNDLSELNRGALDPLRLTAKEIRTEAR